MKPLDLSKENPNLNDLKEDFLYHFGLGTSTHNLRQMFGDVRFVCMGGTRERMRDFAHYLLKELEIQLPTGTELQDISGHSHRYAMYKVGPVLSMSHGMGVPSLSIELHEITKLLWYAGVEDPVFFRIGTSGGVGLEGGVVVVSDGALNSCLEEHHEYIVLGEREKRPTGLDQDLAKELDEISRGIGIESALGKTLCTDDFYEGQGRLDGAICPFNEEKKMAYLRKCVKAGVKNIEMEATMFASFTKRVGIRAAIVCVTLLERLNGDQISTPKSVMQEWQTRPQKVVAAYIKKHTRGTAQAKRTPTKSPRATGITRQPTISEFTSYEN